MPSQVVIKDAMGLYTNFDAADIPLGGTQVQINVIGEKSGYVSGRQGWVRVKFRNS